MASRIFEPLESYAHCLKHGWLEREFIERMEVKDGQIVRITVKVGPHSYKSWDKADVEQKRVNLVS